MNRWATVAQVDPLRVRFDGEDAALPITPDSLAPVLTVGDRVLMGVVGRRLVVLGRAAAPLSVWQTATLLNSWTGSVRYRLVCDRVEVQSVAVMSGASGTAIFTLPEGMRPGIALNLPAIGWNNTATMGAGLIAVATDGTVTGFRFHTNLTCSFDFRIG